MAEIAGAIDKSKVLNFNVGVLGHIDSGKTSLGTSNVTSKQRLFYLLSLSRGRFAAKALSTVASTAAFDKNPQSRERGITLDLGERRTCGTVNILI